MMIARQDAMYGEEPSSAEGQTWVGFKPFRVRGLIDESETIRSFLLAPADGEPLPRFLAGQYVAIRLLGGEAATAVTRTYSLSSGPGDRDCLQISVKREEGAMNGTLPPGVVSNHLHRSLGLGDEILVRPPLGSFTLSLAGSAPLVLLSAGVGITPVMSMLDALVSTLDRRPVWFLHGARSGREQAFRRRIAQAEQVLPNLTTHTRYSRPGRQDVAQHRHDSIGRIDMGLVRSVNAPPETHYFLCGPLGFLRDLYRGLRRQGVPAGQIHYEHFGVPVDLAVEERPVQKLQAPKPIANADRSLSVTFARSGLVVPWDPDAASILELAEDAGLSPDHSCRSGICQTCSCRLISGEIAYVEEPAGEPEAGEVLICSARPKGDVVIDI